MIARSDNYEMDLLLDFNNEVYPLNIGDKFTMTLASSLSLVPIEIDPDEEEKRESWRERAPGERDLSDEYEYVMYGKVYRYDDAATGTAASNISIGQRV